MRGSDQLSEVANNGHVHGGLDIDDVPLELVQSHELNTDYDKRAAIAYRLVRLGNKANAQASAAVGVATEAPLVQWRVLAILDCLGPVTQAEFHRRSGMDKGLLSRTVSKLRREGLVAKAGEEEEGDALAMTDAGHGLLDEVRPVMTQRLDLLFAEFDDKALAQLETFLDILEPAAERRDFSARR